MHFFNKNMILLRFFSKATKRYFLLCFVKKFMNLETYKANFYIKRKIKVLKIFEVK